MATLPTGGAVTLADFVKTIGPDGKFADEINLQLQSNEIIADIKWKEGNLPTGHQSNIVTGLPEGTWRKAYTGVQPTKGKRAQVIDTCGQLEARNEIDTKILNLNGNSAPFRLSEAMMHVEGLNQQFAETLIYGNEADDAAKFTGLAPRYNTLNTSVGTSANVIDAGGTGSDNASVWLVVWGENTIHGIYPKGQQPGLQRQDLGEIDAFDDSNNRFRAMADLWTWHCGLTVKDWRYAVRIANIDVSDLVGQAGTQASTASTALIKLMIRAMSRIPMMGMGNPVFYANRTVKEFLSVAAMDKSNAALAIQPAINQFGTVAPGHLGNGTTTFLGVPVRTIDKLLSTEARITT